MLITTKQDSIIAGNFMPKPNYCSNCGKKIQDKSADVCPSCGERVEDENQPDKYITAMIFLGCIISIPGMAYFGMWDWITLEIVGITIFIILIIKNAYVIKTKL